MGLIGFRQEWEWGSDAADDRSGATTMGFDRRRFLLGTAGLIGAGFAGPALAQQGVLGGQAEWAQSYDAGGQQSRTILTPHPILSAATMAATEGAVRVYQDIVAKGGHQPLPAGMRLKLGTRHPNVQAVRQRLIELETSLPMSAPARFSTPMSMRP